MAKTLVPLLLTLLVGLFMIAEFFLDHAAVALVKDRLTGWAMAIMGVTYVLGLLNILEVNVPHVWKRREGWPYKLVLLAGVGSMLVLGFAPRGLEVGGLYVLGEGPDTLFKWIFEHAYTPLNEMMFALLAFFLASAAFRAFRARSLEAGLLLTAAVIVMLGRVGLGAWLSDWFPWMQDKIMMVPNLAAKRAIMIGAALGAISTGLRVILGLERGHLGGE